MTTHLNFRVWAGTALLLATFQNGQSQKRISDAEAVRLASVMVAVTPEDKAALRRDLDALLGAGLRPAWKDLVLRKVHERLDSPLGEWEKNGLGFVRLTGTDLSATLFQGRVVRYRLTPDWLKDIMPRPDLMSQSEAADALRQTLRTRVPSGWSVDPSSGGTPTELNYIELLQSFEWTPRYRGYELAAGVGSRFAVDRVSGAVTEFWMNAAFLPRVKEEDAPAVDAARQSALKAEALRVYAQTKPISYGVASPGGLQLWVPSFDELGSTMTPRLRRRADDRDAVLVFVMTVRDAQTARTIFIDAVTGKAISIHESPSL